MEINCRIFDSIHLRQALILLYIVFFLLVCVLCECLPWEACLSVCVCASLSVYSSTVFWVAACSIYSSRHFQIVTLMAFSSKYYLQFWSQPRNMLITKNIFISDGQVLMQTMYPKKNALMSLIVNYPLSKQKTLTWTHKLSNKHSPHNLINNKHQDNNFIIWG